MKIYFDLSINKKLLLNTIVVIMIMAVMALCAFGVITKRYNALLYRTMADSLSFYIDEIDNNIDQINDLTALIITTNSLQTQLETMTDALDDENSVEINETGRKIYAFLNQQTLQNPAISSIGIVRPGKVISIVNKMHILNGEDKAMWADIHKRAAEAGGKPVWVKYGNDNHTIFCVRSIRKIKNLDLSDMATLVVAVDLDRIIKNAKRSSEFSQMAILSDGNRIYSEEGNFIYSDFMQSSSPYQIEKTEDGHRFMVQQTNDVLGWKYISYTQYEEVYHSIRLSFILFIAVIMISGIFAVFISRLMTRNITYHLNNLFKKMESFKKGNLSPLSVSYNYDFHNNELALLHRRFDEMLYEITRLINEDYKKQLLIKEAELKALKFQINPHFLFNTLDTIYWSAKAAKQSEIYLAVSALANLLRSILDDNSDTILLGKELDLIDDYIKIQRMRTPDRLTFKVDIDKKFKTVKVPKLCVQPLIENAIKYALEEMVEECAIWLRAYSENDTMLIEVFNTGTEFEPNFFEKLKSKEIKAKGQGVGLENIELRIKLLYGEEYGLSFYNNAEGAIVRMALPYR